MQAKRAVGGSWNAASSPKRSKADDTTTHILAYMPAGDICMPIDQGLSAPPAAHPTSSAPPAAVQAVMPATRSPPAPQLQASIDQLGSTTRRQDQQAPGSLLDQLLMQLGHSSTMLQQQQGQQQRQRPDAHKGHLVHAERLWAALHMPPPPSGIACGLRITDVPWLCPEVTVTGVGKLALPLCLEQAQKLAAAAEHVPGCPGVYQVCASETVFMLAHV